MDQLVALLSRESVVVALTASAPPLAAALAVGLGVGFLQAATQIQDPTAGVVFRLAAVLGALAAGGGFMAGQLVRFARSCFAAGLGLPP